MLYFIFKKKEVMLFWYTNHRKKRSSYINC